MFALKVSWYVSDSVGGDVTKPFARKFRPQSLELQKRQLHGDVGSMLWLRIQIRRFRGRGSGWRVGV